MAARYVGVAVVVVAATVVFAVERQYTVVMELFRAVAYIEAGRRSPVVVMMREKKQPLRQKTQDKDNFDKQTFP